MSKARGIAIERAEWLTSLCADKAVKLVPLRVAVIIANHINSKLGEAWPSQGTIAGLLGMKKYNVTKAVRELSALGYLAIEKGKTSNRYRLRFPSVPRDTLQSMDGDVQSDTIDASPQDIPQVSGGTPQRCLATPPISEDMRLISEGRAHGARPNPRDDQRIDLVTSSDTAGAPDGARLHGRLLDDIEQAFGRQLHDHEAERFAALVDQIGRPAVHARLAAYRVGVAAGTIKPTSMARWLRQSGLMEVSHVA